MSAEQSSSIFRPQESYSEVIKDIPVLENEIDKLKVNLSELEQEYAESALRIDSGFKAVRLEISVESDQKESELVEKLAELSQQFNKDVIDAGGYKSQIKKSITEIAQELSIISSEAEGEIKEQENEANRLKKVARDKINQQKGEIEKLIEKKEKKLEAVVKEKVTIKNQRSRDRGEKGKEGYQRSLAEEYTVMLEAYNELLPRQKIERFNREPRLKEMRAELVAVGIIDQSQFLDTDDGFSIREDEIKEIKELSDEVVQKERELVQVKDVGTKKDEKITVGVDEQSNLSEADESKEQNEKIIEEINDNFRNYMGLREKVTKAIQDKDKNKLSELLEESGIYYSKVKGLIDGLDNGSKKDKSQQNLDNLNHDSFIEEMKRDHLTKDANEEISGSEEDNSLELKKRMIEGWIEEYGETKQDAVLFREKSKYFDLRVAIKSLKQLYSLFNNNIEDIHNEEERNDLENKIKQLEHDTFMDDLRSGFLSELEEIADEFKDITVENNLSEEEKKNLSFKIKTLVGTIKESFFDDYDDKEKIQDVLDVAERIIEVLDDESTQDEQEEIEDDDETDQTSANQDVEYDPNRRESEVLGRVYGGTRGNIFSKARAAINEYSKRESGYNKNWRTGFIRGVVRNIMAPVNFVGNRMPSGENLRTVKIKNDEANKGGLENFSLNEEQQNIIDAIDKIVEDINKARDAYNADRDAYLDEDMQTGKNRGLFTNAVDRLKQIRDTNGDGDIDLTGENMAVIQKALAMTGVLKLIQDHSDKVEEYASERRRKKQEKGEDKTFHLNEFSLINIINNEDGKADLIYYLGILNLLRRKGDTRLNSINDELISLIESVNDYVDREEYHLDDDNLKNYLEDGLDEHIVNELINLLPEDSNLISDIRDKLGLSEEDNNEEDEQTKAQERIDEINAINLDKSK